MLFREAVAGREYKEGGEDMSRTGATRLLSTSAASAVHQTLKALADMRVRWGGLHASVCCIALRARAICASCIRLHAERCAGSVEHGGCSEARPRPPQ